MVHPKPKPDPYRDPDQASAFEKEQVLLIAFTNHWCTRRLLALTLNPHLHPHPHPNPHPNPVQVHALPAAAP